MKKILILTALVGVCILGISQPKTKTTNSKSEKTTVDHEKTKNSTKAADKYHDNVDDRMKGPKGEKVYIGTNGGRYYLNSSNKKVYVPSASNKKTAAKH